MNRLYSCIYPDIPPEISEILNRDDKNHIIVGVIGKSQSTHCNKMMGFNLLTIFPELMDSRRSADEECCADGRITFYFRENENILYVHFETTYDYYVQQMLMDRLLKCGDDCHPSGNSTDNTNEKIGGTTNTKNIDDCFKTINDIESMKSLKYLLNFNSYIRTRFAKMLLFATQICHIIVLVETSNIFDVSYLSIFKSLKSLRERYVLKFLPKLLNDTNIGGFLGKDGRLCSPRVLFYFEKTIPEYEREPDNLQKLEFEIEDSIYKMLRNEFIITNNSSISLFSIPRNKRFVYINRDLNIHKSRLEIDLEHLNACIDKSNNNNNKKTVKSTKRYDNKGGIIYDYGDAADDDDDDEVEDEEEDDELEEFRPFEGFAKPIRLYKTKNWLNKKITENTLTSLLNEHVTEAIESGFDDNMSKYKGKSHFTYPTTKTWFETFTLLHKIFVENPDDATFETDDEDYKYYIDNFQNIMDIDNKFFAECSEDGLEKAIDNYKDMLPHHYNRDFHEQKYQQSYEVLLKYAREPYIKNVADNLKEFCDSLWMNGKQQCEYPSLRGNLCILPKHNVSDSTEHSSGIAYVSACNCGRTQGRREDPYTIKQANYDFYQILKNNCNACQKLESINFAIFQPSINDYRAAQLKTIEYNQQETTLSKGEFTSKTETIETATVNQSQCESDIESDSSIFSSESASTSADRVGDDDDDDDDGGDNNIGVDDGGVDDDDDDNNNNDETFDGNDDGDLVNIRGNFNLSNLSGDSQTVNNNKKNSNNKNNKNKNNNKNKTNDDDDDDNNNIEQTSKKLTKIKAGTAADRIGNNNRRKKKTNFDNETMFVLSHDSCDSVNKIVIKVSDKNENNQQMAPIKKTLRQPSTTEYLPSMLHTQSPMGLLPQFSSWSLLCIGPSSIYSHSTGLPEHAQSGFLSGANYLLPWDVQVHLANASSWAAAYEQRLRYRKRPSHYSGSKNFTTSNSNNNNSSSGGGGGAGSTDESTSQSGKLLVLKIFVGCEYECPRGHRFIMNSPTTILRCGSSAIVRDNGGKVVFNDMPLYFPCPCRQSKSLVGQLMRVHVVTPKAPVNVNLEPRVRTGGKNTCIFVTGLSEPSKLSQSAYWILRLPYIYQNEDGPVLPPIEITAETAMSHGCLLAGMYTITETID